MWFETDYRRIFMDMHLNDSNPEYLSKLDVDNFVAHLKEAGASSVVVKAHSHVGLNYWPSQYGKMHSTLQRRNLDYVKEMTEKCHAAGISVIVYFSQIYDNYAYEAHPSWRLRSVIGLTSYALSLKDKNRYGLVCPNNPAYRQYCKNILTELCTKYQFEGMFLDMPFWPFPCYCKHCQKKYLEETGKPLPLIQNPNSKAWQEFIHVRQRWMQEFILENTNTVKSINPNISIEHNMAAIGENWSCANVEVNTDASDYAGGDYYGGYLQQSFMCKFYNNITRTKPFSYITSRCDKNLYAHTVSRTRDDLLIHSVNALFHNGAFSICDAMNPDGTFTEPMYTGAIQEVFALTKPLEPYVSGNLKTDVAVLYSTNCKVNANYIEAPMQLVRTLKEHNVAFDVVGSRNLKNLKAKVLCLAGVFELTEEEFLDIQAYVEKGGSLFISDSFGQNKKLEAFAGVAVQRESEYTYTYIEPKAEFSSCMKTFDKKSPYPIQHTAKEAKIVDSTVQTLATITYPYTKRSTRDFSAIHSDPPGIHTLHPAVTLVQRGKGQVMWVAMPLEQTQAHHCRQSLCDMILSLMQEQKRTFTSNAPEFVEILAWEKEGEDYLGLVNQQETTPVYPIHEIEITLPTRYKTVSVLSENAEVQLSQKGEKTVLHLAKLDVFCMLRLEK